VTGLKNATIPSALLGILGSLMILGCSSLGAGGGDGNLVANPDFESGSPGEQAPGWMTWQKLDGSTFRVVRDASIAHSGSQCASIEQKAKDQRNAAIWSQQMAAKAGTTYRFSFWIRTDDVQPLTRYNENWPTCCGSINFLNSNRGNLPPYPQSANVFMTHDWQEFEISFTTPKGTAFVQISLVLGNAVGTVYFDSASLHVSQYHAVQSPGWLPDAVGYNLGPWEFSWLGNGNAFRGSLQSCRSSMRSG
jgi:hypothetical protein